MKGETEFPRWFQWRNEVARGPAGADVGAWRRGRGLLQDKEAGRAWCKAYTQPPAEPVAGAGAQKTQEAVCARRGAGEVGGQSCDQRKPRVSGAAPGRSCRQTREPAWSWGSSTAGSA